LYAKEKICPIKEVLLQISRIAKLEMGDWQNFFDACNFIEKGATIFDGLLMSFCTDKNEIISSDGIYKKFGFNVIKLNEDK
jgi:hypothetical protein